MAYEPAPNQYQKEHRYQFFAKSPSGPHVVVSGYVGGGFETLDLTGNPDDDDVWEIHEVYLIVGPWWKSVKSVVPTVTVAGFRNKNADEDDMQGWEVRGLTWDTVGGTGPFVDEERIRLKFWVHVLGINSKVTALGYYLFARGRELGHLGLDSP
jgi:hypothetical protein